MSLCMEICMCVYTDVHTPTHTEQAADWLHKPFREALSTFTQKNNNIENAGKILGWFTKGQFCTVGRISGVVVEILNQSVAQFPLRMCAERGALLCCPEVCASAWMGHCSILAPHKARSPSDSPMWHTQRHIQSLQLVLENLERAISQKISQMTNIRYERQTICNF